MGSHIEQEAKLGSEFMCSLYGAVEIYVKFVNAANQCHHFDVKLMVCNDIISDYSATFILCSEHIFKDVALKIKSSFI